MREHSILLSSILFFSLMGLGLYQLRIALVVQSAYNNFSNQEVIKKHQTEPKFLVEYSKEDILLGNYGQAKEWLHKALRTDPVYIPAWLTLAELENNSGHRSKANEILEYLDDLMKDVLRWRWEKAMLAYLIGRDDILTSDLAWLLQQDNLTWKTKRKVLDFSFSLWPAPGDLLKKMGKVNAENLFYHALRLNKRDTADFLWPMLDHTQLEAQKILPYINLLIKEEKTTDAAEIWKLFYQNDALLYNGNFALPLVKKGFGWRIWQPEGVKTETETPLVGPSSLHIRFAGKKNINFHHVSQIIPLSHTSNQHYILTGELRSKGISTDQRPFVEIVGRECSLTAKTEMVLPDQEWAQFTLDFLLPEECQQGIVVRLRRLPSRNIDSLIRGDLWMTNFALQPVSQSPSQ
ncbi:MAG: hypothetical protein SD837_13050 [Candidatus Electrothrix scaldis]|nr:MAG: hypothetical protein SD837_13050 [Candidatus Electrothrix sp. GW3-3]